MSEMPMLEFAALEEQRIVAGTSSIAKERLPVAGGGVATYGGAGDWITHCYGLCIERQPTAEDLEQIEDFYFSRGTYAEADIPHFAPESTIELLTDRGWRFCEVECVYGRELVNLPPKRDVTIRPGTSAEWLPVGEAVFGGSLSDSSRAAAEHSAIEIYSAEIDGDVAGAAMIETYGKLAGLFAGGTYERYRNRGIQQALIVHRLHRAAELGCDVASLGSKPTASTARNASRLGFTLRYNRNVFRKARPSQ